MYKRKEVNFPEKRKLYSNYAYVAHTHIEFFMLKFYVASYLYMKHHQFELYLNIYAEIVNYYRIDESFFFKITSNDNWENEKNKHWLFWDSTFIINERLSHKNGYLR